MRNRPILHSNRMYNNKDHIMSIIMGREKRREGMGQEGRRTTAVLK